MPSGFYVDEKTKRRLRRVKRESRLSISELAERFELSVGTVWQILSGYKRKKVKK